MAYCQVKKVYLNQELENKQEIDSFFDGVKNIISDSIKEGRLKEDIFEKIRKKIASVLSPINTIDDGVNYDASMQALSDKLRAVLEELKKDTSNNKIIDELQSLVSKENLLKTFEVNPEDIIEEEESPYMEDNEDMPGEEQRLKETLDSITESFYGNIVSANSLRQRLFEQSLVDLVLINNRRRVRTPAQLNAAIIRLKNAWFKSIVQYINSNSDSNLSEEMFNKDGVLQPDYRQALNKFYNLVQELKESEKLEQYVQNGWSKAIRFEDDAFFNALNAYVNLVYFDSILDSFDNSISIREHYMSGSEFSYNSMKYELGKNESNKRKGFQNSEQRNADKDLGKFPKLVLSSIPIIKYGRKTVNTVTLQQLMMAWTNLLECRIDKLPANIQKNLFKYRGDVSKIEAIFQEIADPEKRKMLREAGLDQESYDILYSVAKKVYDKNNPDSYLNIELESMKEDPTPLGYSLVNTVNGIINRSTNVIYGQFVFNKQTGSLQYSLKKRGNSRKNQFNTINSINNPISTLSHERKGLLRDRFNIDFNTSKKLNWSTMTIPINGANITISNSNTSAIVDSSFHSLTIKSESEEITKLLSELKKHIDLTNLETIRNIVSNANLDSYQTAFRNILEYIDSYLNLNLLTEDGLNTIRVMSDIMSQGNTVLAQLLVAAAKTNIVCELYYRFEEALLDTSQSKYTSELDFYKFLTEEYTGFTAQDFNNNDFIKKHGYKEGDLFVMTSVKTEDNWVDSYADAVDIVKGSSFKSTLNDLQKNKLPNVRVSFLGGDLNYYINKYKEQIKNATFRTLDTQKTKRINGFSFKTIFDKYERNYINAYNQLKVEATNKGKTVSQLLIEEYSSNNALKEFRLMKMIAMALELNENSSDWAYSELKQMMRLTNTTSDVLEAAKAIDPSKQSVIDKLKNFSSRGQGFTTHLLFDDNASLIEKVILDTDSNNRNRQIKQAKKMSAAELYYSAIFGRFFSTYYRSAYEDGMGEKKKNPLLGTVLIQPTTFSDKVTTPQYAINVNKKIANRGELGPSKSIWELTSQELIELYGKTIGKAHIDLYNKVIADYSKVIGRPVTVQDINDYLNSGRKIHEITREFFDAGIEFQENTYYTKINGKYVFNPLLEYYATDLFANPSNLARRFQQLKMEFVNELINSGVNFYVKDNYSIQENVIMKTVKAFLKEQAKDNSTEFDQKYKEFYENWIENGKLIIAKQNGQAVKWDLLTSAEGIELNPLLEKFFYTDSVLSNNLRLELTGTEIGHPIKAKVNYDQELTTLGITTNNGNSDNPFLNLRNKKGKPKIIFGHPAIGKTWVKQNNPKLGNLFIDWDDEFNARRNEWIKNYIEKNGNKLPGETAEIKRGNILINPYQTDEETGELIYKDYVDFLESEWTRIKNKAQREGKILLVSPHFLLRNHASEFDAIIDMDHDQFIKKEVDRRRLENPNYDPAQAEGWKTGIDASLTIARADNPELQTYMIQQGETLLSLLNNADQTVSMDHIKDIKWLREHAATDPRLQALYYKLMQQYESVAQGAQLKRNVIIPATLQLLSLGTTTGVKNKTKVAVIEDTQSEAYNFRGEVNSGLDSRDGSAEMDLFQYILENKSLDNQEVGVDRKPIWHHFNPNLGTASLVKFAAFVHTPERMKQLGVKSSAYTKFKKMNSIKWDDSLDITEFKPGDTSIEFDFNKHILKEESLIYEQDGKYYTITDFGKDEFGYYTVETEINPLGAVSDQQVVYHKFNQNGDHLKFRYEADAELNLKDDVDLNKEFEGLSDINTLFKLYNALGGMYCVKRSKDANGITKFIPSFQSSYAVVNFMNYAHDSSGNQFLKDCHIGYLINKSAFKNGAANINPESAWNDDSELMWIELDNDNLGPQMDADHTIDEAELTEFSQVIAAIEAGGRLHHMTKKVYRILGTLALQASSQELNAAAKYIQAQNPDSRLDLATIKSYIYDVVGRTIIAQYKPIEGRTDLSQSIMSELKKKFNFTENHNTDKFFLPLSDSNIYQQAIIDFISQINKKSIKRKYPGSGCVMAPAYNTMMTYKYDGKIALFQDVYREAKKYYNDHPEEAIHYDERSESFAEYQKRVVHSYLQSKQEKLWKESLQNNLVTDFNNGRLASVLSKYIPTDIVDVLDENGNLLCTISLDKIYDYYRFKGYTKNGYDPNTTIQFIRDKYKEQTGQELPETINGLSFATNITAPRNLAPVRITFSYTDANGNQVDTNVFDTEEVRNSFMEGTSPAHRENVQRMFDKLAEGEYKGHKIFNLQNKAAELIVSNMYASKFETQGASMKEILESENYFAKKKPMLPNSSNYALAFINNSGNNTYISFTRPHVNTEDANSVREISWNYTKTINGMVFATTKDGQILFQIGYLKERPDLLYNDGDIVNSTTGEVVRNKGKKYLEYNGSVHEYIQFATQYSVVQQDKARSRGYKIVHIDKALIDEFKAGSRESESEDRRESSKFVGALIRKLYANSNALTVMLNQKMNAKSALILKGLHNIGAFRNMANGFLDESIEKCIGSKEDIFKISKSNQERIKKGSKRLQQFVDSDTYNTMLQEHFKQISKEIFASFERSRYYIASRIPAQTLQSFMQMEAVAFADTTKNVAYVSHWQTWLQGSDY